MRRVVRPQALVVGILAIIIGLIFLLATPLWADLVPIGIGILSVQLSGYIIKTRY